MRLFVAAMLLSVVAFSTANAAPQEVKLRVMSFNIKGLPWPLVKGKRNRFRAIGDKLASLRKEGQAPHVLLLQEGFTGPINEIISRGGYKYFVKGPNSRQCSAEEAAKKKKTIENCKVTRLLGAGLYIISDYPIIESARAAFGNGLHCTGWDCKANKGVAYALIQVPGIKEPVSIFNTHMNSRGASGSSDEKVYASQKLQLATAARFLDDMVTSPGPVIFAGDFNISSGRPNYDELLKAVGMPEMGDLCFSTPVTCHIPANTDPNRFTGGVDHHFAAAGLHTSLLPVFASHSLTKATDGYDYSDHPAYTIEYSLRATD